jgi:hypothetical protein
MTLNSPRQLSAEQAELLARRLRAAREVAAGGGAGADQDRLERAAGEARSQLSSGQQRLWFIDQLKPGNVAYHVASRYRITGPLDTALLQQAFGWVVARHSVLRARFPAVDGQPHLAELDPSAIPLRFADLSGRPDALGDALALARDDRKAPFDLAAGPLARARLLRLGPADHVLVFTFHHAIFDGLSAAVLEHDLSVAYSDALAGRPPSWPPLAIDYPDYAAWQHRRLAGPAAASQALYWRNQLGGASPALQLPTDYPRPSMPSYHGSTVPVAIPAVTADQLRVLAHAHNATLFMVGLAAYQVLLARHTRDPDITIGCPFAGRTRPELEKLIGFFVSSLPLRSNLAANPTFTELLQDTRITVLDAFDHQDLPFERIIKEINPVRDTSRNPLIQAWFDLSTQTCQLTLGGTRAELIQLPGTDTRFDLELQLYEHDPGAIAGHLTYATDLFERASMERLAGRYGSLLATIAADPGRRVAGIGVD